MYSSNVHNLPPSSPGPEKSLLWWRHPFYRSRWKQWHGDWLNIADTKPASAKTSPAAVLARLKQVQCDPDVALRLAFLEASHKPATQSELAKDSKRQQQLKRNLDQSRNHLWKAMLTLTQLTRARLQDGSTRNDRIDRKVDQYRNHVLKAAVELEEAQSDVPLIFVTRVDIVSLRAMSDTINPDSVGSLKSLIAMCDHELETLLWPRAVELAPGHELFTLVSYVEACSGQPNFPLVTDLLGAVYNAQGRWPPTRKAIEKQVERFAKLNSIQPELIRESTFDKASSGELRQELLAYYPKQPLP